MSDPLSPFERELVNAMDEYAHHTAPPGLNAERIIAHERRRVKVRISLATASLATAAGIAACVATSAPGNGHAGLPVTGGTTTPATDNATPSPATGSAHATTGTSGTGNANGGGTGNSATPGGVAPSWPTAATSSPFTGSVPPVPVLVFVRTAVHPEGGYDRISFEFTGQAPGYHAGYVQQVVRDGSGAPVSLHGTAFLQLTFNIAQAHDANGNPTLTPSPTNPISLGYAELRSYVLNGDFEGTVSIALGLNAPHGFHVSELTKSATDHVIYVDVAQS